MRVRKKERKAECHVRGSKSHVTLIAHRPSAEKRRPSTAQPRTDHTGYPATLYISAGSEILIPIIPRPIIPRNGVVIKLK